MKIRNNFKQRILRLLDDRGFVVIYASIEAEQLLLKEFPENSYLGIDERSPFIIIRKTLLGFDIRYRRYGFSCYNPILGVFKDILIRNTKVYIIDQLK